MDFASSERAGAPPKEITSAKIVVAGGFGVGKTTMVGAAVLVDTRRISDAFAPLDYFENRHLPYLVALNCFDGAPRYEPEEIREALAIAAHVPLVMCDARHRDSVKTVLVGVVEHAMATLVAEQGRGHPATVG